jgi:Dihydrodipicolinate synthetase family
MNPQELKHTLSSGLLTFPVTDFDAAGNFRPATYAQRLDWLTAYRPRVLFAAGALGEFFSLTPQEFVDVIRTAVDTCRGKIPIIARSRRGYPNGDCPCAGSSAAGGARCTAADFAGQFEAREKAVRFACEGELPSSQRHARFSLPLRTPFKPDDLVFHPRFGRGRIIEEWGSWLDVDPNGGQIRSCGGTGVFEVEFDTSGRRSVNGARLTPIEFAGYQIHV